MNILFWIVGLGLVAFEMAAGIGKESGNTKAKIAKTTVSSYAKTNATTERIEKTIGTKKARGNAKEARDAK